LEVRFDQMKDQEVKRGLSTARSALNPMTVQALVCQQDSRRVEYDLTPMVDDDSNSDEEGACENENDDTNLFF